jgi:glycosyltransferase involved in cell wall biosynthesis
MNIGIDIRTLMDGQYSGVSEYTLNLLNKLFEIDRKNNYKLFYNSAQDVDNKIPNFNGRVETVSTKFSNKIFNYVMQKGLKYPLLDKLLGVDVFYAPHTNFSALSKDCKKIITVHDLSYLRYKEFFSIRKNFWHSMINVKKILTEFDTIVAISENTKRDLIEILNIPENKIVVIHSGVGDEYRSVAKDNFEMKKVREKYNLPKDFILYLGTIEPRKNVEGAILAFEKYLFESNDCNLNLILAGANGWKNKEVFDIINNSEFKDRITYLGYIEKEDKKYLYNLTKLLLFPSFYEGFGFPPLEAMSCGTPVITSNISSLPEVVQDGAILVDSLSTEEISQGISLILAKNDIKNKLIEKTRIISKTFSWENTAKKYLELY